MPNLFHGMASESGIESFAAAFIQIHLASILSAIIAHGLTGVLYGLVTYLISLHILVALTYILDVRDGRVLKAIFQRVKQEIRPNTDGRYLSNLEDALSGLSGI